MREITRDKDQSVIEMGLRHLEFTFLGVFNERKYRFKLYDIQYQFGRIYEGILFSTDTLAVEKTEPNFLENSGTFTGSHYLV